MRRWGGLAAVERKTRPCVEDLCQQPFQFPCSHWIFQHLKPYAMELKTGAPVRLKAITAGKRKTDCLDARMLADLLRCNLFPECYVMPPEYAELRRQLRYRALLVHTEVQFKTKAAGLLIENGVAYDTNRLHRKKYFSALIKTSDIPEELKRLLGFNRMQMKRCSASIAPSSLVCDPTLCWPIVLHGCGL